ncbi:MAG: hypothetical protein U5O16_23520 [Rhodococcus sp. (in: high G+C Gram-positive bacteria)]|uniref:hypothetical protein n=1 Tax=Rhodococcus sp. TaxID=1831 RepID=UPI002ADB981F|nr:hypothetical protein [Rhodococcus sp. (in: high G+C Gram-positive bacteria)]
MIPLEMSVVLTVFGILGILHLCRTLSHVLPLMAVTIQGVWIATCSGNEWWTHVAIFAIVAAHAYGIFVNSRTLKGES